MKVISTNCLDDKQRLAAEKLIREVQDFDETHRTPYLSNSLNFDEKMPAFFLGYEDERLVALLTVYADSPAEAEVAIMVHPDFRRKGYARQLFHVLRETLQDYHLEFVVMSERAFLSKNPDLLPNLGMKLDDDFEYWLTRNRQFYPVDNQKELSVTPAQKEHLEAIAEFQSQAFGESYEVAFHYVKQR